MNIEIVAIGNEILKGLITNTNTTDISQALFSAGYRPTRHTTLSDDETLLKSSLKECLHRSRIVITTGGLGPTCDDTSRQVAAELFESDFVLNKEIAASLRQRYGNLLISLENQATVPSKAIILTNDFGTAPGLAFHTETSTLLMVPGVPREMNAMLHHQVIPFLEKHFPKAPQKTQLLHFFGITESAIDPFLRDLQQQYPKIELGIYPAHGTLAVQLTAQGYDETDLINATEILRKYFADNHFEAPHGKLEEAVHQLFTEKKWTLSLAESCTGGAISARLTKLSGCSNYHLGGIVSYSNESKINLLHVPAETIVKFGAVSQETAIAMALGMQKVIGSDISLAITGIAGPTGGTKEKPIGTIWIAIAQKNHPPIAWTLKAHGNREMIIERSVNAALAGLLKYCK